MLTKEQYIAEMRSKEEQAKANGYTDKEIKRAYEIANIMGVKYLSSYTLERAREELKECQNYLNN